MPPIRDTYVPMSSGNEGGGGLQHYVYAGITPPTFAPGPRFIKRILCLRPSWRISASHKLPNCFLEAEVLLLAAACMLLAAALR